MKRIFISLVLLLSLFTSHVIAQFKLADLINLSTEFNFGGTYPNNPQQTYNIINGLAAKGFTLNTFSWQQELNAHGAYDNNFVFDDVDGNSVHELLLIGTVEPPVKAKANMDIIITDVTDSYSQYSAWITDLQASAGYTVVQQNPLLIVATATGIGAVFSVSIEISGSKTIMQNAYAGEIFKRTEPLSFKITVERDLAPPQLPHGPKTPVPTGK